MTFFVDAFTSLVQNEFRLMLSLFLCLRVKSIVSWCFHSYGLIDRLEPIMDFSNHLQLGYLARLKVIFSLLQVNRNQIVQLSLIILDLSLVSRSIWSNLLQLIELIQLSNLLLNCAHLLTSLIIFGQSSFKQR